MSAAKHARPGRLILKARIEDPFVATVIEQRPYVSDGSAHLLLMLDAGYRR